ncbi:MAG: LLM class flavin-dependent oxidoreductase [Acetobacteraceae bacterium]
MALHLMLSPTGGTDVALLQAITRAAERGGLDAVLFAGTQLDPLPLMGSMIGITRRIGLAAGWTVDFTEPFHVARVLATLDHLSYGRSAWFVEMFDTDRLLPLIGKPREAEAIATYCERAGEFIAVVKALWDSWEDEAFALDKATGMFVDPDRVNPINHAGRFFTVRGPLNLPRPPQGTPPLIMRDPEDAAARRFVAKHADIVLTGRGTTQRCDELRELAAGREIRVLADCVAPDELTERLRDCPCDGINLVTDDVEYLLEAVIPQARSDGLLRPAYAGTTLREHFRLSRPRSQFAVS